MVDRADELYGLAPGEFTAARDALAKELRAGGDREAAAEVKALRRPTVVAWAINHAARTRSDELAELLAAGATLRDAHDQLLQGNVDRAALRQASEGERAAVGAFARVVREEASAAGSPLANSALDKVRDTLHAAALDDDVRAALEGGRLVREAEAVSAAGMLAASSVAPASSERPTSGRAQPAGGRAKTEPAEAAAREPKAPKRTAAERRATAAAHEAAIRDLREADREAKRAERDAEVARRKVERAERAVEKARADLADAEADLEAVQEAALDAQRDFRDAKAALAAAQQAVDAAADRH